MIQGIDVSHYEPPVDWAKAHAGGVQWMYTKATEGLTHKDKMLKSHITSAQKAGVLSGCYHFFHASLSGGQQADHFLSTAYHAGLKFELPPVLDWESSSTDGETPDHQMLRAKGWLSTVASETGRTPIIYGGESHLKGLRLLPEFAKFPLWIAHYGVGQTGVHTPKPWAHWTMWQYTDAETVPGLQHGHHVDANWFNGSLDDLKKL